MFVHKGYICVEFFFILSGFLLFQSFERNNRGTVAYTVKRIQTIFPKVWLLMIPYACGVFITDKPDIIEFISRILNEFFSISSIGIFGDRLNGALWYISILLFAGTIIYGMLNWNKKICINAIFPITIIILYTAIIQSGNGNLELGGWNMPLTNDLCRGLSGMSLGVLLAYLSKYHAWIYKEFKKTFFSLFCFSIILFVLLLTTDIINDAYCLLVFSIIIFYSFRFQDNSVPESSFLNCIVIKWGSITLDMYIVHRFVGSTINQLSYHFILPVALCIGIYLFLVVVSAIVLHWTFSFKLSNNRR